MKLSLYDTNPELINEWDKEKNGNMRNYTYGSHKKVGWICNKNNHHKWNAYISNRTRNNTKCSICTNQMICPIDQCNSLYYNCSDLLKLEWNEEQNGSMKNYTRGTGKKVGWICSKNKHHKWNTKINHRTSNKYKTKCPICLNRMICPVDQCNSLYYNCSDLLKLEWNEKKNGSMKKYAPGTTKKVSWICGKYIHHEWCETINNRNNQKHGCPICSNHLICPVDQCNSLYYNCSDLLKLEWNEKKNGSMKKYSPHTDKKAWWICNNNNNHKWIAYICSRVRGMKCPICISCPKCQMWRTYGELCAYCKPKNKNNLYKKTKEWKVVKYLKKYIPDHVFIHNRSVGNDCTDGHLFPDIRFDCGYYNLIIEVDEHKHRGANYQCDKQRMYDIIAKLGQPCIFIRYNPDNKKSNLNVLLKIIKKYLNLDMNTRPWNNYGYLVKYLFY